MTGKELQQSKNFHTACDGDKLSLRFLLAYEVQGLLYLVPAGPQGQPIMYQLQYPLLLVW